MPISSGNLFPIFDVYDFDLTDAGTVYLEQLDVYSLDVPSSGWTSVSVPAFTSWTASTNIPPFNGAVTATTGGLGLASPVSESYCFSLWNSGNLADMVDNQLYRAVFTVRSSDTSPPNGMFRIASQDLQVSYRLRYYPAEAPDTDGEEYPVYFETHDYVPGQAAYNLNFEIADFESTRGGAITLTDTSVQHHTVP